MRASRGPRNWPGAGEVIKVRAARRNRRTRRGWPRCPPMRGRPSGRSSTRTAASSTPRPAPRSPRAGRSRWRSPRRLRPLRADHAALCHPGPAAAPGRNQGLRAGQRHRHRLADRIDALDEPLANAEPARPAVRQSCRHRAPGLHPPGPDGRPATTFTHIKDNLYSKRHWRTQRGDSQIFGDKELGGPAFRSGSRCLPSCRVAPRTRSNWRSCTWVPQLM